MSFDTMKKPTDELSRKWIVVTDTATAGNKHLDCVFLFNSHNSAARFQSTLPDKATRLIPIFLSANSTTLHSRNSIPDLQEEK